MSLLSPRAQISLFLYLYMQVDYDNLVHDQQEKLASMEQKLSAVQRECYEKVEAAAELAERQNALTMTLEAKVRGGLCQFMINIFPSFFKYFFEDCELLQS